MFYVITFKIIYWFLNYYGQKLSLNFYFDSYLLHIDWIFQKKFEEYRRIKEFQGINGAKSIYIKCNHHNYAKKKAWYKTKLMMEVLHKHYILFQSFIKSITGSNIPKKKTLEQHERSVIATWLMSFHSRIINPKSVPAKYIKWHLLKQSFGSRNIEFIAKKYILMK